MGSFNLDYFETDLTISLNVDGSLIAISERISVEYYVIPLSLFISLE